MPINCNNGKIYKIVCNETGEQYFGSTTQELNERIRDHRSKKNKCTSKQIIERGNYQIVLCEAFACNNKEELLARERKWIDENECINKKCPIRSIEEKTSNYYKKEYQKKYQIENRDKINKAQRERYKSKKEKLQIEKDEKQKQEEFNKILLKKMDEIYIQLAQKQENQENLNILSKKIDKLENDDKQLAKMIKSLNVNKVL